VHVAILPTDSAEILLGIIIFGKGASD